MQPTIGVIGAGNMATSVVLGLLKKGWSVQDLMVSCRLPEKHIELSQQGVQLITDNLLLAQQSDVIILATKPQQAPDALKGLQTALEGKCLISVAAGLSTQVLVQLTGNPQFTEDSQFADKKCSIIRTMPNTPALIGQGITGLFATEAVKKDFGNICEQIFDSVGQWVWIEDETLMDVVTATSGSGPAYVFLLAESMMNASIKLGMSEDNAHKLVVQTLYGAACLLKNSGKPPIKLREAVTSKAGTTEAALQSFAKNNFNDIVEQALIAARDRGIDLASEL